MATNVPNDQLLEAALKGNGDLCTELIEKGAYVNYSTYNGWTSLHGAAQYGCTDTVTTLLAAGADIEARDDEQWTSLHVAAQYGRTDTVTTLLAAGADIEARDNQQRTSLHRAAGNGHTDTVTTLLAAGADIEATDNEHRTSLHLAAEYGRTDIVNTLLAAGAEIEATDYTQNTPLQLAAECNPIYGVTEEDYKAVVIVLMEKGAASKLLKYDSIPETMANVIRGFERTKPVDESVKPENTGKLEDQVTENQPRDTLEPGVNTQDYQHDLDDRENVEHSEELHPIVPQDEEIQLDEPVVTVINDNSIPSQEFQQTTPVEESVIPQNMGKKLEDHGTDNLSADRSDEGSHTKACVADNPPSDTIEPDVHREASETLERKAEIIPLDETVMNVIKNTPIKVAEAIQNEVSTQVKVLNNKIDNMDKQVHNQMSEITDMIIKKVSENVTENLKLSIDEALKTVSNIVHDNTEELKKNISELSNTTKQHIVTFTGDAEHNSFVDFQLFDIISDCIGQRENVGNWKKLGKQLFGQLPQEFSDEIIAKIDSRHPNEKEKAYEVLVYWKTFAFNNGYSDLMKTLCDLGLGHVQKEVSSIINAYNKDKERGHRGSLTEQGLCNLSADIGNEWEHLGIYLDFKKARLEQLRMDNLDVKTVILKMLLEWRNKTPGSVHEKLAILRKSLQQVKRNDLAETLTL